MEPMDRIEKAALVLYLNLGGEMIYVLQQRLSAQKVAQDKSGRVLQEVIACLLCPKQMAELTKLECLSLTYAKFIKCVFERIVQSSIMRLNRESMDKLYDLMTMVFKYQVLMVPSPRQIVAITLNHLDTIEGYVKENLELCERIAFVKDTLVEIFFSTSLAEFQTIRYQLLTFLQDLHVRISMFLKTGVQKQTGVFSMPLFGYVTEGFEVNGTIREFGTDETLLKESTYVTASHFSAYKVPYGSRRGTVLGTNMYTTAYQSKSSSPDVSAATSKSKKGNPANELSLLMQLVNPTVSKSKGQDCVALNLLGDLTSPSDLRGEVLNSSGQEEGLKIIDLTLERRRNSAHEVHEEIECKAFTPEDTLLDMIDATDAS
ncbi:protein OSCP1-like [Galendromus occidentalis]|uniref:Protein OSCP1-like n=1 Tax=Galendromus occidentalis TaxID=34638 RepID=A0AAJ7SII8_9ACAR|nr:protein OSCP1-like [Galendromus occidentalis]